MKYHLITYGCQMNTADSEEMAQPLRERGFLATGSIDEADVVLMNTCTVRDQAEHRAKSNLGRLEDWKAADPRRVLIVAGCAASRWGGSIQKRFPFIDLVSPATKIEEFPELVAKVLDGRWDAGEETALFNPTSTQTTSLAEGVEPSLFGTQNTAYVTIMRGCNYSCSYCIVPQVRGREKYRPLPDILLQIRESVAQGRPDVMLLGQTVNSYYYRTEDSGLRTELNSTSQLSPESSVLSPAVTSPAVTDFADLLRSVDAIDGVREIRFMSPHPRHMRARVIQAMAECPKVARHLHLPVQSGSDAMLQRMNRLYNRRDYQTIVDTLRTSMPGIKITTDVIVGHPEETVDDFNDTLSLMRDVKFDGLFAFKYSPRPGTVSSEKSDDVPDAMKEERLQTVLALNRDIVSTLSH